jgi:hypothetical protein
MKRIVTAGAVAALAVVGFAGTASAADAPAYGKQIKDGTGLSYGQVLNAYRGAVLPGHGDDPVFPSASGAKTFWQIHAPLFN